MWEATLPGDCCLTEQPPMFCHTRKHVPTFVLSYTKAPFYGANFRLFARTKTDYYRTLWLAADR
jgi:hypothetical protein